MDGPILLTQGDVLLGTLLVEGCDMPWWEGQFSPTPEFEPVRPVLAAWTRAVRDGDETAMDSAGLALDALGLAITVPGDAEPNTLFMLHVEGDRFSLRY